MESPAEHKTSVVNAKPTWTRYTTCGRTGRSRPTDHVELGPGDVAGLDRRLLGDVNGLRVLDLGTGVGHTAVALARAGARVVAIEPDAKQLGAAREAAESAEVHVELHQADYAELAFLHAEVFDVVLSVHALAGVEDLGRVFRQVHRVLKPDRPLVLTLPHPAALAATREQFGGTPVRGSGASRTVEHTMTEVFTLLTRSNYRVDTLLEPAGGELHPASLIMRGRKVGN